MDTNETTAKAHDDLICQSCSMPLSTPDDFGTNADGSVNAEYCIHCFKDGRFTNDYTLDEMVDSNLRFLDEFNAGNGTNYSEDEARPILKAHLAGLKRWRA